MPRSERPAADMSDGISPESPHFGERGARGHMTDGQCLCGTVRYEVSGSLGEVRYCHCSRCRHATGSAFSANAKIARANFRIVSGQVAIREYEERPGIFRAFCSICGSPVYARLGRDPDNIRVRLGGLSGEVDVRIAGHVWVSSKSSWYEIEDSLPCYAETVDGPRLQKT
jgi:hypothetical protein